MLDLVNVQDQIERRDEIPTLVSEIGKHVVFFLDPLFVLQDSSLDQR
jgi:hypothetical protein